MGDPRSAALIRLLASDNPNVEDALLYLSSAFNDPQSDGSTADRPSNSIVETGRRLLDELAETVASLNLSPSNYLDSISRGLFVDAGFVGDVENYHAEDNSFLDRVLVRRIGMPITLSAVVVAVARRLGHELNMIGLPGHVVVGVPGADHVFIDAFGGAVVDRHALEQRLHSIFGRPIEISASSLTPMTATDVVTRVCNNLMRTWSDAADKFDRLLELRVQLPMGTSEHRMLLEITEARARFDLAATLRESADPNDPEIDALWGRLN